MVQTIIGLLKWFIRWKAYLFVVAFAAVAAHFIQSKVVSYQVMSSVRESAHLPDILLADHQLVSRLTTNNVGEKHLGLGSCGYVVQDNENDRYEFVLKGIKQLARTLTANSFSSALEEVRDELMACGEKTLALTYTPSLGRNCSFEIAFDDQFLVQSWSDPDCDTSFAQELKRAWSEATRD